MKTANDLLKRAAAEAALEYLIPGAVLGVGTGSTVNHFIDLISERQCRLEAAVSSSEATTRRLQDLGVPIIEANDLMHLPLYVDGADEVDPMRCLIKGGGGALTREKILADLAERFICIVYEAKCVDVLGVFPLPIEVLDIARGQITRKLEALGAQVKLRKNYISDNGHPILDVSGLSIHNPAELESRINQWPGVVAVGLFAARPADMVLVAGEGGIKTLVPEH